MIFFKIFQNDSCYLLKNSRDTTRITSRIIFVKFISSTILPCLSISFLNVLNINWSCFQHKERGLRAPLKGASETGASHGYQRGPQRQAWDAKAADAATRKPVCKHRSLSTPPLPGACAARHCQGPVIQGQLPRRTQSVPQAVAMSWWPLWLQAHPASIPLPPTGLSEPEPPNQLLVKPWPV